jgi:prepilin-type N-terminal cleavage/methylation domain-containing protein
MNAGRSARGFTLVELLVVVAIVGLLAALLAPALSRAKDSGRQASCLSNLHQVGIALELYAQDHLGSLPYGPSAPPFTHPAELYPSTGSPTSLLSLRDGRPVALGLLLDGPLAKTPRVLFCPGSDQAVDATAELAKVGTTQAQGSYHYRHGGVTELFQTPEVTPRSVRLADPGENREGRPIRALVTDTQFLCSPEVAAFNVKPRTHHRRQQGSVLWIDGSATRRSNRDEALTIDLRSNADLYRAFDRILGVFERLDREAP